MELGKFGKELARAFGRRKALDNHRLGSYVYADLPSFGDEAIDRYVHIGAREVSDQVPLTWFSVDHDKLVDYVNKRMDRRSDIDLKDTWMEMYYGKPRYRNK
jgi:hypothetical protein